MGRGTKKRGVGGGARHGLVGLRRGNARHSLKHAATNPPPAGPPEAHAEVLCRRRQRHKHASVLKRQPRGYGNRQKLVEGTSPRRLTCHCTDKAGYIYSSSLPICRVVILLLRQRRGAGLGELLSTSTWPKQIFRDRSRPYSACFARRPKLER